MREPLRQFRAAQQKIAFTQTYPAPISGWNSRDALASMKPTHAVTLKNLYPRASYVEFRGGWASHATGMTGNGKTLAVFNKQAGSNEMFAMTASGIYDVSSAGAVGAAELVRTDGKHQHVMFEDNSGDHWMIALNGVDDPAYYDGSTWITVDEGTSPALTNYTSNAVEELIDVMVFKGRLLFIPRESLSFWYLPAGVAGGALAEFPIGSEATKGGYLIGMATWTRDSGAGVDDFAVFFTSEGEAIVYQGTNPSSATTWAKVGSYTIGRPLGRRCVIQYGGDCLIMTENGVFPMSALLQSGEERAKFALSYNIQPSIMDAARAYGDNFGWRAIVYPAYDALLVNIPITEDGEHQQYVMNTLTKAWCHFEEWDAEDFAVFNGELYFCVGTEVRKAWTGTSDGGDDIVFYGKQAFQDFRDPKTKHVQMYMPMLSVNGSIAYASDVDIDFSDNDISNTTSYDVTSSSQWDVGNWDEAYWASTAQTVKQWSSPAAFDGRWIATKLKIASNALTVQWTANMVLYEHGDGL